VAGPAGAIAGTVGIFLPAFVLVAVTHRFVSRLRENRMAQALLDGINAAAVALMFVVTWHLARSAIVDSLSAAVAIISAVLLWRYRCNSAWLVLGAAMIGFIASLVSR
jgi:chromate transporter